MKKILLISHDASLTGAPKSITLIGQLLQKEGHEIRWIVGKKGPRSQDFETNPTKYWTPDLTHSSLIEKIAYRLKGGLEGHKNNILKWVKNWNPDLIINNTVVNGEIVEQLSTFDKPIISRIPEMQSVMAFYDTFDHSTSKVFKYSQKIVAASNAVKEQIVQNWNQPEEKVRVIYTGSDMEPLPKEKHDRFTVSACGSLIRRKGIDLFLLIAKYVTEQVNDVNFIWIGGTKNTIGYFEILEDIRKLGLSNKVEVVSETKDIRPYLSKSDAFLMTSREDPFPIVNLEALKHNLPIFSFRDNGGSDDLIELGAGYSVPYLDVNRMVDKIIEYKVENHSNINIQKVLDTFSTNRTKEGWLEMINPF